MGLFVGHNRSQTPALKMRETHIPSESVWERLVRAVKEGSKRPPKSLKGSKLRRTSNLTFSKYGVKLHSKKKTVIAFVLQNHRIRDKYVRKILLQIQNKSKYIYLWWKGKGTAQLLRNVPSKSAEFCSFGRHIENEATTMQRNRTAHTACSECLASLFS